MIFETEQALIDFAENLGKTLKPPVVFELVGDVGAGKTTFTKALAKGLGVKTPVTSPSFTICNRYELSAHEKCDTHRGATSIDNFELIHYDFYRLKDPGLMLEDLKESLTNKNAIVVLEWANSVKNILPKNHIKITFQVLPDGSRELTFSGNSSSLDEVQGRIEAQNETYSKVRRVSTGNSDAEIRQATNLYLDTSDFIAKIQLTDETGETFEYEDDLGREMAEKLLETLENHLKEHNETWKDIAKITFYSGPGSFTGLRIGAAIVNTLAHELNIPLYDHKGTKHQIILPDYGRPANISSPKK